MSDNMFLADNGDLINVNDIANVRPNGWTGDIIVSGSAVTGGLVYDSKEAEFYGVYWRIDDGTRLWITDFTQESLADEFASKLENGAQIDAVKYQMYIHQAALYQLENKLFRRFESECDVPGGISPDVWSGAVIRLKNGSIIQNY